MKRNILILVILIFSFLILEIKAETEKLEPIDNSSPIIQAVVARQKAQRNNDLKTLWEQLTKKSKEGRRYDSFKELRSSSQAKKRNNSMGKAQLIGMRFITNNRVWVEANASDLPDFKGFYLIKEDGEWKFARMALYLKKVKEDIEFLGEEIQDYYRENQKLPQTLSDLLKPTPYISYIPLDLFNDNEAPYVYKVIAKTTCRIYSLGPDSDDDLGETVYQEPEEGSLSISDGDIVKDYSFQ